MNIQNGKNEFKKLVRAYEDGVKADYIKKGDPTRTSKIDGAWAILRAIGLSDSEIEELVNEAQKESDAAFA